MSDWYVHGYAREGVDGTTQMLRFSEIEMSYISENRTPFTIADVTVNINTVNRPDFLEACLGSLIRTTPPEVALQIVFNGSPKEVVDRVIEQAGAWKGPTNFVVLDEILPISESHNRALSSVETRLVNFCLLYTSPSPRDRG